MDIHYDTLFIIPKRTSPISNIIKRKQSESSIITSKNRFEAISSSSENDDIDQPSTSTHVKKKASTSLKQPVKTPDTRSKPTASTAIIETRQTTRSRQKMPPIVLDGVVTDINKLRLRLKDELQVINVQFKFTRYSTLLFTNNSSDYHKVLSFMEMQANLDKVEERSYFHTYTPATDKTHGFVIRGLDH